MMAGPKGYSPGQRELAESAGSRRRHHRHNARRWPVTLGESRGDRGLSSADPVGGNQREDRSAEPTAHHPGAGRTCGHRDVDRYVGLRPGDLEVIAQRRVRVSQQWADSRQFPAPEDVSRDEDATVLGDDVPGPAPQLRIGEPGDDVGAFR